MSGVVPAVAHGQVEINDHLQHMKIPLGTRQVLVGAVAVREAGGVAAVSALRSRYVAIRAGEGRPVACYVHRTMLSVALDPDVAATVCAAHRYCVPEPAERGVTRHVRIKHADVRMYAPIVGELLLVALQRSWERSDLADQAEDQPPAVLREGPAADAVSRTPNRTAAGARGTGSAGLGARRGVGVTATEQPSPAARASAPVRDVQARTRSTSRTPASSPAPRPAPAMCPIHFHPLINGECDYCA